MMNILSILFVVVAAVSFGDSRVSVVSTGDFNRDFYVTWSPSQVKTSADGKSRSLSLDKQSGCGFASNNMFLFGQFDMQIKLIPGNSAGTVVAYYLVSSGQSNRDELDFEFLGNVEGQPYTLQTNVFVNGFGSREQRFTLWFDPTKDFHTYSILWNTHQIVFMVDWVPIRTYRNHSPQGVAYPSTKPMNLLASIWNGESWATNGGQTKIDWAGEPFITTFRDNKMDACPFKGSLQDCWAESPKNWWNNESSSSLSSAQRKLYKWARKNYLNYDYCQDQQRFHNNLPKECSLSMY